LQRVGRWIAVGDRRARLAILGHPATSVPACAFPRAAAFLRPRHGDDYDDTGGRFTASSDARARLGPDARVLYKSGIFELDEEHLLYREWLFAAHSLEVPEAGRYLTLQIGAHPILLVCGSDGIIRAFTNSCRHRGARHCPDTRGIALKLVCPCHQWTYALDGRRFAARQMGSDSTASILDSHRCIAGGRTG
jgi:nitrite reductase/ring-hydroxylating ferredoxin subunit